ncbi:hypothetical protein HaLaN_20543, partial [Haematococcus lacustris]
MEALVRDKGVRCIPAKFMHLLPSAPPVGLSAAREPVSTPARPPRSPGRLKCSRSSLPGPLQPHSHSHTQPHARAAGQCAPGSARPCKTSARALALTLSPAAHPAAHPAASTVEAHMTAALEQGPGSTCMGGVKGAWQLGAVWCDAEWTGSAGARHGGSACLVPSHVPHNPVVTHAVGSHHTCCRGCRREASCNAAWSGSGSSSARR